MVTGLILKDALISGANNIARNRVSVDELNIFPVPDGDTGTNMSMTVLAGVKELSKIDSDIDCSEVANINASALLRGARGNSGVITSLLFRGFAKGLAGLECINGADLVEALTIGVDAAYKAVMKPTEGTILTVSRVAAEHGRAAAVIDDDIVYVWRAVCDGAKEALDNTPELLPVLKKAGVVDAGGQGLCMIFDGMMSVFEDGIVIENVQPEESESQIDAFRNAAAEFDQEITFTYCTEFIVGRNPEVETDPSDLRAFLETIGDCVLVVDDDEIIKVHVHTEDPGDALQRGLAFGQLLTIKIENMKEQQKENAKLNEEKKQEAKAEKEFVEVEPVEEFGFVSVCAGEGLETLFTDLGCDNIVSGGQTMNPSTDDLLKAIKATPAKNVFVLPNNKNIIMAATQAKEACFDRNVIVLPTKTIPQGLSAMLSFDPSLTADENTELMASGYENVSTGQVTFAARDSEFGGHKIKEGEIMGLDNGKLTIVDKDVNKVALKLTRSLINKETSFVTVIYGSDVTEDSANSLYETLRNKVSSDIEITMVNGGQPIYYYVVSVE